MYQQPKLNRAGKAEEIIQGYFPYGQDFDGNFIFMCMEFADENEDDPKRRPGIR
jgi:hypothetical protein